VDGEPASVPLLERSLRRHVMLATSPQRPFTQAARVWRRPFRPRDAAGDRATGCLHCGGPGAAADVSSA